MSLATFQGLDGSPVQVATFGAARAEVWPMPGGGWGWRVLGDMRAAAPSERGAKALALRRARHLNGR